MLTGDITIHSFTSTATSMQTRRELYSLSWKLLNVTLTAVVHLVKPCLNFLHYAMWKVVKFIIPRGGSPASACFGPTKHDRVTVTPTCLTSQRSEARYHRLMGAVWHTGRTPLVYPYWNLQALSQKAASDVTWFCSHVYSNTAAAECTTARK